tara:strand:- start:6452 stop:7609 length:1158 start_codon:yes stop_codon:yes gene_type:complete
MARNPINPAKRNVSLTDEALSDFDKFMQRFAQSEATVQRQKELIDSLDQSNKIKKQESDDRIRKSNIQTFETDYYNPIIKNSNSTNIKDLVFYQKLIGMRDDGTSIYDAKRAGLVGAGGMNDYESGRKLSEMYDNQIAARKEYQGIERNLRNVNISDEDAVKLFDKAYKYNSKGIVTDVEMNEIYGLMASRKVPGFFEPKESAATGALTKAGAASNYSSISKDYTNYLDNFTPTEENKAKYIPQEYQDIYELGRSSLSSLSSDEQKIYNNLDSFFKQKALDEANSLFYRAVIGERSKEIFAIADPLTKRKMFEELAGLAIETMPELKKLKRSEIDSHLKNNPEVKDRLVEKIQDALGPYEGWRYLLENKDPTGNVRLRIIELDTQ